MFYYTITIRENGQVQKKKEKKIENKKMKREERR